MARIRYTKYSRFNNRTGPKLAFFHDDNYNKALKKFKPDRLKQDAETFVALNKKQEEGYDRRFKARINPRKYTFHKSSRRRLRGRQW